MAAIKTNLADLGKAMKELKISVELEGVSPETFLGYAIRLAIKKKELKKAMQMIVDNARDNRELTIEIVGKDLLKDIESVCSPDPDDLTPLDELYKK
jgi:nitrogen regulatory protein PII-like uncharacterized protein